MKPLVIIGAGGYAQELLWVADDVNSIIPTWDFLGYVDPKKPQKKGNSLYDRPILGGFDDAHDLPEDVGSRAGLGIRPRARESVRKRRSAAGIQPHWCIRRWS